jgi:hypothetical protein
VQQSQLDAWVAELPSHRPALRAFVLWATQDGYMDADLQVPATASRELRSAMDNTERLQLARQLLRERPEGSARPAGHVPGHRDGLVQSRRRRPR